MLAVMTALLINAGVVTFSWLKLILKKLSPAVFYIIYAVLTVATIAVFIGGRAVVLPNIIIKLGSYALGFYINLILITVVVQIVRLLLKLVKVSEKIPSAAYAYVGAAVCLLTVGFTVYGWVNANVVSKTTYEVEIENAEQHGELKIAMISDVHLGNLIDERHLAKAVDVINSTNPDVVCILGDLFDGDFYALRNPEKIAEQFLRIESRYGVYVAFGNHDAGSTYEQMVDFCKSAGMTLLREEAVTVGGAFTIVGRADSRSIGSAGIARTSAEAVLSSVDSSLPVIVMDHQPTNIREYGEEADLILCGHTHKGQIIPINFITNLIGDVDYGYYKNPATGTQTIVSSGVGIWGPIMRTSGHCEVAEITVRY
jgi:predicted MPP superfamily phosphohydrolase